MLKNSSSKVWSLISWLSIFDKLNVLLVVIFFFWSIIFPIASIIPIGDGDRVTIRLIGLEYRKTSVLILVLLTSTMGMSINGKFKSWFLIYTGITNEIFARFIQKIMIIILLVFFGEIIIHLRGTLTQTINLSRWYYLLSTLLIAWLVVDFLFLQRRYKYNNTHQHTQTTITQEESHNHEWQQGFKNLFDE